ncbi:MAG: DUF202 domain-containing protein [Actinomycetes bacterium]
MSRWAHDPERGLAGERTDLAWNRTGLAMLIILGAVGRNALQTPGVASGLAVGLVAIGAAAWGLGLRGAHRISQSTHTGRHRAETRLLATVTAGTIVVGLAALVISI